MGEASHGTSEFYRARAAITERLVRDHGFTIVAVEADWPDAATYNRYIRGLPPREGAPAPFRRWRNSWLLVLLHRRAQRPLPPRRPRIPRPLPRCRPEPS